MPNPATTITTAQLYFLIQKLMKRVKYLESVVAECCGKDRVTSFSTGFRGDMTTSNTGGYGSSPTSDSSSALGSQLTTGTGSASPDSVT